jgi:hypothetical protein
MMEADAPSDGVLRTLRRSVWEVIIIDECP